MYIMSLTIFLFYMYIIIHTCMCRAMHMMRAELIAWSYTIALLEAMFTIRQELVAKASLTALYAGYSTALTSLSGPVKKAAHCGGDPFYCEQPYNCFTGEWVNFSLSYTYISVPSQAPHHITS